MGASTRMVLWDDAEHSLHQRFWVLCCGQAVQCTKAIISLRNVCNFYKEKELHVISTRESRKSL